MLKLQHDYCTELNVLKSKIEDRRREFAELIGLPIDDSGDNLHWAAIARGRIEVLEKQLNIQAREWIED